METAVLLPSRSVIKKNSKFTDLLSSLFMKVRTIITTASIVADIKGFKLRI